MSDVLVVGGGIIVCSVAIEPAERDASVTLIEAVQPGTRATGASAGILASQWEAGHPDPLFRFAVESRRAYPGFVKRLERLAGWRLHHRQDGMLVAIRTPEEEEEARRLLRWQRREGLCVELVDPSAALQLHEKLSPKVLSGLWLPDEGQVNAQLLASGLGEAVRRCGVRLRLGTRVTGLRSRGARVEGVRTESGDAPEHPQGGRHVGNDRLRARSPVRRQRVGRRPPGGARDPRRPPPNQGGKDIRDLPVSVGAPACQAPQHRDRRKASFNPPRPSPWRAVATPRASRRRCQLRNPRRPTWSPTSSPTATAAS